MSKCTNCLEPIIVNACASDCPRYGYNSNIAEVIKQDSRWNPRINIHGSLSYLRKLRNAATACPNQLITVPLHSEKSLHITLGDLLWHQTEMLLRSGQTRFYSKKRQALSLKQVIKKGKNTIDPTTFHYVTWVTEGGKAHAMTQADIGRWFLTVASSWAETGYPKNIPYYLYLARAAFRSFEIPDTEGGVRNNKRNHKCFNNMYCYWFHSRSISSADFPETVLNQHLHAVRDALSAYLALAQWRDSDQLLPEEFRNDPFIDQLKEYARGGLFQLAYARGSIVDSSAPPNLANFLKEFKYYPDDPSESPIRGYYAHYRYFFDNAKPRGVKNGDQDISAPKTCHYHYHSISLLADILTSIRGNSRLWEDPHFKGIYYKFLYGRNPGDTRHCEQNQLGNQNDMATVPLQQFSI